MRDFSKLKVVLKLKVNKVSRTDKSATPDGFNGYGKFRSKQHVYYGYFTWLKNKSGIYCITCKVNNQKYIGASKDIYKRISKHFSNLRLGKHPNHRLQIDYNKYGIDKFVVTIIEETTENLLQKEAKYQSDYNRVELYNLEISGGYKSDAQRLAWATYDHAAHKTKEYKKKMHDLKANRIGQFDRYDGHKIAEYEDSDAACKASGLAKSTLLGCCNGSKKTGKGYIWHYLDSDGNIITSGKGKERTIMIHNEDIV